MVRYKAQPLNDLQPPQSMEVVAMTTNEYKHFNPVKHNLDVKDIIVEVQDTFHRKQSRDTFKSKKVKKFLSIQFSEVLNRKSEISHSLNFQGGHSESPRCL